MHDVLHARIYVCVSVRACCCCACAHIHTFNQHTYASGIRYVHTDSVVREKSCFRLLHRYSTTTLLVESLSLYRRVLFVLCSFVRPEWLLTRSKYRTLRWFCLCLHRCCCSIWMILCDSPWIEYGTMNFKFETKKTSKQSFSSFFCPVKKDMQKWKKA